MRKRLAKLEADRMSRPLLQAALVIMMHGTASALPAHWATDDTVGPNRVVFELSVGCSGTVAVCQLFEGYADTDTSFLSGQGILTVDEPSESFRFHQDSTQDLLDGRGPIPTYLTLGGTHVRFEPLPIFDVPETESIDLFSVTTPEIIASGLDLSLPGEVAFSTLMSYAGIIVLIGDLAPFLPVVVGPPQETPVSGLFRVLGDVDLDGWIEFEIRELRASFGSSATIPLLDADVTVTLQANLEANLSGEIIPEPATHWLVGPALVGLALVRRRSGPRSPR